MPCWALFLSKLTLGVCNFAIAPYTVFPLVMLAKAVQAVTSWDTSLFELMVPGERTITMGLILNMREGLSSKDDNLPDRLYGPLIEPMVDCFTRLSTP